jgi:hypothetical protein
LRRIVRFASRMQGRITMQNVNLCAKRVQCSSRNTQATFKAPGEIALMFRLEHLSPSVPVGTYRHNVPTGTLCSNVPVGTLESFQARLVGSKHGNATTSHFLGNFAGESGRSTSEQWVRTWLTLHLFSFLVPRCQLGVGGTGIGGWGLGHPKLGLGGWSGWILAGRRRSGGSGVRRGRGGWRLLGGL